jgi:hypothetical protein
MRTEEAIGKIQWGRVTRFGQIGLGSASVTSFAIALFLLAELRLSISPVLVSFPTETGWLSYYWWYTALPAESLYAALLGAYLGLLAIMVRRFTPVSAKWSALISSLVLVNLLYAIIPGGLFYRLAFYPPLESAFLDGFVLFVKRLPGETAGLDLVGLTLVLIASILAFSIWKNLGRTRAFLRAIEVLVLALLPLPIWVYLLDRREFSAHIADVQAGTALAGITNADLLIGLSFVLPVLIVAESRLKGPRTRAY